MGGKAWYAALGSPSHQILGAAVIALVPPSFVTHRESNKELVHDSSLNWLWWEGMNTFSGAGYKERVLLDDWMVIVSYRK